jgi:hypothetical protein
MSVEAMDQRLDGRLVEMAQVRCALSGLLAKHKGLWVDQPEGIYNNFALHRLDGIDDDCNGSGIKLLEGLLRVDIDGRKPTAKSRM